MREFVPATILVLALTAAGLGIGTASQNGTPALSITDGDRGPLTPARVELLNENGQAFVPEGAIPVGPGYPDREVLWQGDFQRALSFMSRSVENPYTRTTQFYSTGASRVSLPPGNYRLRVFKGVEYAVAARTWGDKVGEASPMNSHRAGCGARSAFARIL